MSAAVSVGMRRSPFTLRFASFWLGLGLGLGLGLELGLGLGVGVGVGVGLGLGLPGMRRSWP